jgi:hypothetical protein
VPHYFFREKRKLFVEEIMRLVIFFLKKIRTRRLLREVAFLPRFFGASIGAIASEEIMRALIFGSMKKDADAAFPKK